MHPEVGLTIDLHSEGLLALGKWSDQLQVNLRKGLTKAGALAERNLKMELKSGNPTAFFYKSYDYKLRSRTGALRASINSHLETSFGGLQARVGTPVKHGLYNERGARIPVTPKSRAYLHSRGVHLKKSTTELILPPRPWFLPTVIKSKPKIIDTVREAIDAPLRS